MKKPKLSFYRIIYLMVPILLLLSCSSEPDIQTLMAKASLSQAEQQTLATALFQELLGADKDDFELFERNYKAVLEKCPDTEQAHTAVWRLSNLYTLAEDEPQLEKIIAILEPFLDRYTESSIVSMEKYPEEMLVFSPLAKLHQSYERLGQYDKIAAYYDKITAVGKEIGPIDCYDYAFSLDSTDRQKEAVQWYRKFLTKTEKNPNVQFIREVAQNRIMEIELKLFKP